MTHAHPVAPQAGNHRVRDMGPRHSGRLSDGPGQKPVEMVRLYSTTEFPRSAAEAWVQGMRDRNARGERPRGHSVLKQ